MNNYDHIEDVEFRKDLEWDELQSYAGVDGEDRQEFLSSLDDDDISQMEERENEESGSAVAIILFLVVICVLLF